MVTDFENWLLYLISLKQRHWGPRFNHTITTTTATAMSCAHGQWESIQRHISIHVTTSASMHGSTNRLGWVSGLWTGGYADEPFSCNYHVLAVACSSMADHISGSSGEDSPGTFLWFVGKILVLSNRCRVAGWKYITSKSRYYTINILRGEGDKICFT